MMAGLKGSEGLATVARILGLAGLALLSALPARADSVASTPEDGFMPAGFYFTPAAHVSAASNGGVLTLTFDRKVSLDPDTIVEFVARRDRQRPCRRQRKNFSLRPQSAHPRASKRIGRSRRSRHGATGFQRHDARPESATQARGQTAGRGQSARDQTAFGLLRQFHPAGVRLAARRQLQGFSRRGKNDHAVPDAGRVWMSARSPASIRPG